MYEARARSYLSRCAADAFLAGVWNERALVDRAGRAVDRRPLWVRHIAREVVAAYHRPPNDRPRELARFIDVALRDREGDPDEPEPPRVRRWLVPERAMGRRRWPVPEITWLGGVAKFLGVGDRELAWWADVRGLERTVEDEKLQHYRYAMLPRRSGRVRVIERPKHGLKEIQRRVLHEIIDRIPPHEAAHGFTRGRSVRSHASEHTGHFVVVRMDLEDFFACISAARIYGIFRTAGYPESVAHCLTGLSTNVIPSALWHSLPRPTEPALIPAHHRLGRRLAEPHLPQGAPASPALAKLAAFRLDRRLSGLAASLVVRYSRDADDLTFSGPPRLVAAAKTLRRATGEIAREEGFMVNQDKSMLAARAGRQLVCGVVVNQRTNAPRREYDILKAILHNAHVHGPASQNRDAVPDFRAHVVGRISWIGSLNRERGEKLRRQFARIEWDE